jgi:quinol monooxygenase YgiN
MKIAIPALSTLLCVSVLLFTAPLAQAGDESTTIISRLYATPGREAELASRLKKWEEIGRKLEPTVTVIFRQSKKNPALFMGYELFPNKTALTEHSSVSRPAILKELGPVPEGLLERPVEYDILGPLQNTPP